MLNFTLRGNDWLTDRSLTDGCSDVLSESPKKILLTLSHRLICSYFYFLCSISGIPFNLGTHSRSQYFKWPKRLQDDMENVETPAIRYLYSFIRQRRREWTLFSKNRHGRLRCRWQGWHRSLGLRKRSKAEGDHRVSRTELSVSWHGVCLLGFRLSAQKVY